uniref:C-JID domain-containing protein n=1 Tax=Fagus sylvatica TaxID=28930 RepID=A0A2N9GZI3_FAGSY
MGPEVNIKLHYSHLCNDFMGIALCAVLCSNGTPCKDIRWIFIANGKEIRNPRVGTNIIASDHILISYSSTIDLGDEFSQSLVEYDANGFCHIGIRFGSFDLGIEVKKCGVRLLYKKDIEDHIPTDSDSDSTLVTEGNKVKRRRDEYDGVGPSGEGSSNDVPHPKRIERPTEFGNSDSEESSEYKDCDEELSDVQ